MADITPDGHEPTVQPPHPPEQTKTEATVVPEKPTLRAPKEGMELIPSYIKSGNELVVIAKILESINKNIAFLAQTINLHLNPETKDGRPKA